MSKSDRRYNDDEDDRYYSKKSSSSNRRSRSKSPVNDRNDRDRDRNKSSSSSGYKNDKYDRNDRDRSRSRSGDRDRNRDSKSYRDNKSSSTSLSNDKYKERDRSRSRSRDNKKSSTLSSNKRNRKDYSDSESDSGDSEYESKGKSKSSSKESKEERRKRKKEEKKEKEHRKANETRDEKMARRLEKKQKKEANKKSDIDLSGYQNGTNPFNDMNLQEKFVWKAKREKLIKGGMKPQEYDEKYGNAKKRKEEIQQELDKAKSRREQREKEKEIWEEEKERLQRMKDMSNNEELEKKEEEFHYLQACKRCETRLFDNRPKPLDYLYKAIHMTALPFDHRDNRDPVLLIQSCGSKDLEDLIEGIREFTYLDTNQSNLEFWDAALELSIYQLGIREEQDGGSGGSAIIDSSALHHSLTTDIKSILSGKSFKELCLLEVEILNKLESGSAMNVEYWETLLKHLKVYKSCSFLKERFIENIKLKHSDMETEKYLKEIADNMNLSYVSSDTTTTTTTTTKPLIDTAKRSDPMEEFDEDNDFDEQFDLEVALEPKYYAWHDKFRPRKPKFFNRVHTGYDWTKYNRTHYDYDNPPPKVVRGYKFNIFYPDLIDVTKSPQFFVSPSPDNPDTCILRFSAGPPYEDIAFKIVKKEWEKSHKYGYKCVFDDKGVLHLWFNFKRYRYRR